MNGPASTAARRPILSTRAALLCVIVVLVLTNLADNLWAPSWILPTALVATTVLIVLAWLAGCDADDLGLGRTDLPRQLRWAGALVLIVACCYLAAALVPAGQGLFEDRRTGGLGAREVLWRVCVAVPVGTVLLEEVAFRGVLYGLVDRDFGTRAAIGFSSLLFGLWHILPSLHLNDAKPVLGSVFGHSPWGAVLVNAAAVLFTAAAGVVLCVLRRLSGGLLAPMALHWATNAFGYLVAHLVE
ncbi:CPBP family intramembrane glutamic endopeptidase [Streptomyces sp. NPDC054949]|uniref:CPBP family intramembrane glutamic endopeptidase n=1 Tax=unclassified Streptomyces TaxID=2593676 RepID=UPI0022543BDC|nr:MULTISPECIES: CPBP family intramembrane glutamic endopeptidase [unclassified Streptomyces]MCX5071771.1 CPBP family intramembrane metalloprotease [Streptomyces sp. NBC_00424]MCX5157377.1 CPBP family intramembrane metalloprotease [Streptomyces sp. NBC_00291]WUD44849.1 CPBP family intramembrane metalloprotease [Streptomyces sp. NBC_00513]